MCKVSKWALEAEGDPAVTACARHGHHHGPNSPAPEMVAVEVLPPRCQQGTWAPQGQGMIGLRGVAAAEAWQGRRMTNRRFLLRAG